MYVRKLITDDFFIRKIIKNELFYKKTYIFVHASVITIMLYNSFLSCSLILLYALHEL